MNPKKKQAEAEVARLTPAYNALNNALTKLTATHQYTGMEIFLVLQDFVTQVGVQAGLSPRQQINMLRPLSMKILAVYGYDIGELSNITKGHEFSAKVEEILAGPTPIKS